MSVKLRLATQKSGDAKLSAAENGSNAFSASPAGEVRVVATEKQFAANRKNARKSTGPRTKAGLMRSSQNAFRHGLSTGVQLDLVMQSQLDALVDALLECDDNPTRREAAVELAVAQLEFLSIRKLQTDTLASIVADEASMANTTKLCRLGSLGRYERYAP